MTDDEIDKALAAQTPLDGAIDELQELLYWRAEILRIHGHERSCDYGSMARDEIREKITEVRRLRAENPK